MCLCACGSVYVCWRVCTFLPRPWFSLSSSWVESSCPCSWFFSSRSFSMESCSSRFSFSSFSSRLDTPSFSSCIRDLRAREGEGENRLAALTISDSVFFFYCLVHSVAILNFETTLRYFRGWLSRSLFDLTLNLNAGSVQIFQTHSAKLIEIWLLPEESFQKWICVVTKFVTL